MPAQKRAHNELETGNRRRSGRLSATPKKSSYFEGLDDESEDELSRPAAKRGRPSKKQTLKKQESEDQYEDQYEDVGSDEPVEQDRDEWDEDDDDEDAPPKVRIIPLER